MFLDAQNLLQDLSQTILAIVKLKIQSLLQNEDIGVFHRKSCQGFIWIFKKLFTSIIPTNSKTRWFFFPKNIFPEINGW